MLLLELNSTECSIIYERYQQNRKKKFNMKIGRLNWIGSELDWIGLKQKKPFKCVLYIFFTFILFSISNSPQYLKFIYFSISSDAINKNLKKFQLALAYTQIIRPILVVVWWQHLNIAIIGLLVKYISTILSLFF